MKTFCRDNWIPWGENLKSYDSCYINYKHVIRHKIININNVILQNKCTKPIYKQLIACKKKITPTAIPKWNPEWVCTNMGIESVYDAFNVCFWTINNSFYQWLQYKLLHRILSVNYYLKKLMFYLLIAVRFEREDDTIQNVFVSCEKNQQFGAT